jgi:hypothetical protein
MSFSRRNLLGKLGSAALALPFLPCLQGRARAAGKTAKNFLMISMPNGIDPLMFWPSGGERDFVFSPVLDPLKNHRDKLLIVGPQLTAGPPNADGTPGRPVPVSGTGLKFKKTPGIHRAWVATTCHSATAPRTPQTGDGLSVRTSHPSVDQLIANKLGVKTRFPSLEFGVHPVGGDVPCIINFGMDGSPLPRMADDQAAWTRVFGGIVDPLAGQKADKRRSAVSTFLNGRFAALNGIVGKEDKRLLDSHLQSLREVEARIGGASAQSCDSLKAAPPFKPAGLADPANPTSDAPALLANMQDMVALAFSCNLTRVASISMSFEGGGGSGGLVTTWLGFNNAHHGMSHHGGNAAKRDKYNKITTWYASMIARMLDQLKAFPHPEGGTLYDHTLVWWMMRHGDGNAHADHGVPGVLAGGAGGYFGPMGRFLSLPTTDFAQLPFSMVNAMGINIDAFGIADNRVTVPLAALQS